MKKYIISFVVIGLTLLSAHDVHAATATITSAKVVGANQAVVTFSVPVNFSPTTTFSNVVVTPGSGSRSYTIPTSSPASSVTINFGGGAVFTNATGTVDIAAIADTGSGNTFPGQTGVVLTDGQIPSIVSISLSPSSGTRKIGDTITGLINTDSSGYLSSNVTINGVATTGFVDNNNNTYNVTYTVVEGNTSRTSGTIPASVVLTDVAGNVNTAFTTVTANSLAIDALKPTAISAVTGDTNGNGKIDKITVTYSEAVSDSNYDAISVSGYTLTNTGSGTGTTTLVYNLNEGSSADTGATPSVTFNFANATDIVGNILGASGPLTPSDSAAPVLTSLSISSNNANTAAAKTGDTVTLTFTGSESFTGTPTVSFTSGGVAVVATSSIVNTTGTTWTASYVVNAGDTDGVVGYSIGFTDSHGVVGITVTSGAGTVTINKTTPSAPTASLTPGSYRGAQNVTLLSSGSATIRYITNGTTPTCSTGSLQSSSISVSSSQTITAIGCSSANNASGSSSFTYTITRSRNRNNSEVLTLTQATPTPVDINNNNGGGSESIPVVVAPITTINKPSVVLDTKSFQPVKAITRNLSQRSRSDSVSVLQKFLVIQAKGPASRALEKAGATSYFGPLTRDALVEWQKSVGIKPAQGFFGPITREYIKGI